MYGDFPLMVRFVVRTATSGSSVSSCTSIAILLLLIVTSCTSPTPSPYPSTLDIALVHDEVRLLINGIRTSHEVETLVWDETLQGMAEKRAWEIVKGAPSWQTGVKPRYGGIERTLCNEQESDNGRATRRQG